MRQQYFIVVLAHSLHGRLRRIQIPHHAVYAVLALAVLGSFSLFGMVSSYIRMSWKVSNYNSLRHEVDSLRSRYQALEQEANQKEVQLASLQMMANEVTVAFGIKRQLEGPSDISSEGPLVPTYKESLEQYNFLEGATISRVRQNYAHQWQKNVLPSLWPVNGRLLSHFGERTDPFSDEPAIHTGVDISASYGTPVHAAADGVITFAEYSGGYGRLVIIDHGNGLSTRYGHLSRIDVVPGQEIRRGEVLGLSGASGRATSPHLHFEVRNGGTPVNPAPYLAHAFTINQVPHRDFPF